MGSLSYGEGGASFQNLSSREAIYSKIHDLDHPKNGMQFLGNCQFVFLNDLLLFDDFYVNDILKKVFGANSVIWFQADSSSLKITDFIFIPYPNVLSVTIVNQWHVSREALLKIFVLDSSVLKLSFDEVEKNFRKPWKRAQLNQVPMSLHAFQGDITDKHGRERVMYEFSSGGLHRSIEVQFDSQGNLFYLFFSEKGI